MLLKVNTISDGDLIKLQDLAKTINNEDIDLNVYRMNMWEVLNSVINNITSEQESRKYRLIRRNI